MQENPLRLKFQINTTKVKHLMGGKYYNISELAQILNLKDPKTGKFKTHVIRFWETKIKELKADKIINKRRYYSETKVELIKYVKFLLTEKGLRIKGVKDLLKKKIKNLTMIWIQV